VLHGSHEGGIITRTRVSTAVHRVAGSRGDRGVRVIVRGSRRDIRLSSTAVCRAAVGRRRSVRGGRVIAAIVHGAVTRSRARIGAALHGVGVVAIVSSLRVLLAMYPWRRAVRSLRLTRVTRNLLRKGAVAAVIVVGLRSVLAGSTDLLLRCARTAAGVTAKARADGRGGVGGTRVHDGARTDSRGRLGLHHASGVRD
jgi:hypothetical protein